jgi:hypothetical protein
MLPWSMRSSLWLLAVGLLVLFTLRLLYPNPIADESAQIAFAAIKQGATEQEVEAVLGTSSAMGYPAQGGKSLFWDVRTPDNRRVGMIVTFDIEGRVCGKAMQDEPGCCSPIRRWLIPCRQPPK